LIILAFVFVAGAAGHASRASGTEGTASASRAAATVRVAEPRRTGLEGFHPGSLSFVSPRVGFIATRHLWVTTDGGRRWTRQAAPGRVADVEAADDKVWMLVHTCRHCHGVALYAEPLTVGRLHKVRGAPAFHHGDVGFVHGADNELYLQTAPDQRRGIIWRSYSGTTWTRQHSPCKTGGALAAWSPAGLGAVCNVILAGAGEQTKRAFVSFDGAHTWTRQGAPSTGGYIQDLATGSSRDWVLDDERTGFNLTRDGGKHWTFPVLHADLGDGVFGAKFTSASHVVGLPSSFPERDFLYSDDGGQVWSVTRFPEWSKSRRR
jgi:photosystem II stability/assembly factor-like uncharacterized protein